jgi:hypothetical protein
MADVPQIKVKGSGSSREAARLGKAVADSAAFSLAGHYRPLHIDTLHVRLPSGASQAKIDRAIRAAIERKIGRSR